MNKKKKWQSHWQGCSLDL